LLGIAAAALLALAGCGSSSKTTTSSAAAAGATSSSPAGGAYSKGASAAKPTTAASATAASGGVVIATKHDKLGTILAAGPKKLTVYLFEKDTGPASTCSGPCAAAWPPVTTSAAATASGSAQTADLGTITRSDGTRQVTYKGHPLYFFAKDGDAGDAYGEGVKAFGASWYVLKPSGEKVDNS
jgi:predicted lipoprotein with Yx(FWY)xxD motif